MKRALALIAILATTLLSGCGDGAGSQPSAGAPAKAAPTMSPSAKAAKAHPSAAPRPTALELLHFRLTSNVDKKEPVDDLVSAAPGERVWAHATLRNRTKETKHVTLVFRVDGDERTTVDLKVEPSWSWRTWGYVTLRPTDKDGVLTVELRDDRAELLEQKALTIRERK
jgi:hypothetical protein